MISWLLQFGNFKHILDYIDSIWGAGKLLKMCPNCYADGRWTDKPCGGIACC